MDGVRDELQILLTVAARIRKLICIITFRVGGRNAGERWSLWGHPPHDINPVWKSC